jgi:hypothetical protein
MPPESDLIVAPEMVPPGTTINTKPMGLKLPKVFVIALVSDCGSCSAARLDLPRGVNTLDLVIVTSHKDQAEFLRKEWKGLNVLVDEEQSILPPYSYAFVPQLFLVRNQAVQDSAAGAVECNQKWRLWNR